MKLLKSDFLLMYKRAKRAKNDEETWGYPMDAASNGSEDMN